MRGEPAPPLAGITVLDFSELLPGPFLTQMLAEMGAEVIKVERPPHGDNARRLGPGGFEAVNRGKKSVLLDLKDESGRARAHALLAGADVLVESYRPGVMARLGLDHASLQAAHPRLVYVSLSGYGHNGPWAQLPGHDINYLAASGVMALSGEPGGPPAPGFGLPAADLCGAMYALSATLAALLQRQHSGLGQHLDVALADCALHWMTPRLGSFRDGGTTQLEDQRSVALVKPAYGIFRCRDGRHLSVAALEDHFWARLCEVLDMGPFADARYRSFAARKAEAEGINARLAAQVATLDADAAFERMARADLPVAPVVAPTELAATAQFVERGRFLGSEPLAAVAFPVNLRGVDPRALAGAPRLDSAGAAP